MGHSRRLRGGLIVFVSLALAACGHDAPKRKPGRKLVPVAQPPVAPLVEHFEANLANALADKTHDPLAIKVMSTHVTETYTFIEAADKSGRGWILSPALTVDNDADIVVANYVLMRDVELAESELRFEKLLAAASVSGPGVSLTETGEEAAVDPMLLAQSVTRAEASVALEPIEKADYTVAEIFAKREELADKRVKVRGQVIRVAARVGNRNWVWLRDGTGEPWSSLLPVPIDQPCEVGQVLLVEGRVSPDRAFPLGGTHDVILEEAAVLGGAGSKGAERPEGSPLPSSEALDRVDHDDKDPRTPPAPAPGTP